MKNMLHSLFLGEIIPRERPEPNSVKRLEVLQRIHDEERYLMEKLPLDDRQRIEKLSELHTELFITEDENLFSYAFTFGMLLAMDVMKEAEEVFNG